MAKGLITEYDYKDDANRSYQIIREYPTGECKVMNDGLGQTMEIKGLANAMNYATTLNENAKGCVYKVRTK
jgi:hypothetical protein|tara:strand:- start:554 stop:766 length:213 start_codon:yes stop_codon:yes gene_type:complete